MGWMIVCIAALVAADQAVKWWAQTVLAALPGAHASFVPGVLSFEHVRNTGVAFSFFEDGTVFFAVFTAVVLAAMLMILRRIYKRRIRLLNTALVLVIAGGLGNLIDRVARGYVVDMLNFEWISFPVFNVADVLICVGTGLLFVFILFFYEKYFPDKGKSKNNARMEDEDAGRT